MNNLTIERGIVRKCGESLDHIRGYDLVVLEDRKYEVIPEGSKREKKGWNPLAKKKQVEVFAVSNDSKHILTFRKIGVHADGVHNFFVDISLNFKASHFNEDQIILIKKLDRDPVLQIKEEASRLIYGYLRSTEWNKLADSTQLQRLKKQALEDLVSVKRGEATAMFDAINDQAKEYGLIINEIDFEVDIHESHKRDKVVVDNLRMDENIKIAEIEKDIRVDGREQELKVQSTLNKNELQELDRIQKLKDRTYNTAGNYIDQVGSNIAQGSHSVKDAMRDLKEVMEIQRQLGNPPTTGGALGAGTSPTSGYLPSGEENNLITGLYEIIVAIKQANLDKSEQRTLLSALFHLAGSVLGDEATEQRQSYISQLEQFELPKDLRDFIFTKLKDLNDNIKNNNIL